ncbi:MAG: DMT family transporter [Gammaproteobacteria bacterium]
MSETNLLRGALCSVLSAFLFALMGAGVKYSTQFVSSEAVVFLRNAFGLLFLLPWVHKAGLDTLKTKRFGAHLVRTLTGLIAMYCFFYAIAHLKLGEAVLLNFSSPLFIALFALIWLKEPAPRFVILAIMIGFLGVILILKPGFGVFSSAAIIGVAAGVFVALAMVSIRNLSSTEPTIRIVFYFSFLSTLISAVPLLWNWQTPDLEVWVVMLGAGFIATKAQLLMTYAYRLAPAAKIGAFAYTNVIFAATFGWLFWNEIFDHISLLGACLICISGVLTTMKKTNT